MAERFTLEYTGNNSDIFVSDHSDVFGEYMYVGILMVHGSDVGILYAQKTQNKFIGAVYKEYTGDTGDGWVGKVIFTSYQTGKCWSFGTPNIILVSF